MSHLRQAEMLAVLQSACADAGSQAAWAKRAGFHSSYVCQVLSGRREISEAMANALGYFKEVRFVPAKELR